MSDANSAPEKHTAPVLPAGIAQDVSLIFERHPEIGKKITRLWGSIDLQKYLSTIIFDDRGGRHGFSETVALALFRVNEGHNSLIQSAKRGDVWDVILDRIK
jgi:hypothetical protein